MIEPYWKSECGTVTLYCGTNEEISPLIHDIDACVVDPPYELGFMGKGWDKMGVSFDLKIWQLWLNTLQPGAHALVFGGTRTFHRIAIACEDAGFEFRDTVMWLYGQGFPKSLDISKAIDKKAGAEREVVGVKKLIDGSNARRTSRLTNAQEDISGMTDGGNLETKPATDLAKQWDGWGTALKPAFEPILLLRKPLSEPTVAANVLKWGTGGLNIDACRVGDEEVSTHSRGVNSAFPKRPGEITPEESGRTKDQSEDLVVGLKRKGRWPANLVHDGSQMVLELFPNAPGQCGVSVDDGSPHSNQIYGAMKNGGPQHIPREEVDKSAARFFYCAKSSKSDRNLGLDGICCVKHHTGLCKEGNMELVELLQKVISELTVSWLIDESGENIMGLCQSDFLSTTLMEINKITTLQILPLLTPSLINAFIVAANCVTANGGNHVGNVQFSNLSKPNTTSANTELALGVSNAVLKMLLQISAAENWNPLKNIHSTVKPQKLCEWLCKMITPPGGTVLDQYMGSGSTGVAAVNLGFKFIGVDISPEYCAIAKARIEHALKNRPQNKS